MITQCNRIVPHHVHRLYLYLTFEKIEVGGALQEIAGIEQEEIPFLFSYLFNVGDTALHASFAGSIPVCCRQGLNTTVRIVCMQDDDLLLSAQRKSDRQE